jgi:hypothetical protein
VIELDIIAHHRERARLAELRADGLEIQRDRMQTLLMYAIKTAAGNECDPLVLLRALEEMIDTADELSPPGRTVKNDLALLRDTDPAKFKGGEPFAN